MGDRCQMKDRVILNRSVESSMIAERAFRSHFPRLHKSLQHEIGIGRNFDIDSFALHQLDRFFAQESGEQDFVEPIG